MTPAYDSAGVQLYCGDTRDLITQLDFPPAKVLLCDPPYAAHRYIRQTDEAGAINIQLDTVWSGAVFEWVGQWFWPVRQRMALDGVGWIFCNPHYLGFYVRWAKYARWPLRGIFHCPPDEFLLALGAEPLSAAHGARVSAACQANTYGQNKPLSLLRTLLEVSPDGMVLDPFAGLGSSLDAAKALERPAVGVEIDPSYIERTIARWQ